MTLGKLIPSRDIDIELEEGDFITDVVVIAEVFTKDGGKYFTIVKDEHTDWLKEYGMVSAAKKKLSDDL